MLGHARKHGKLQPASAAGLLGRGRKRAQGDSEGLLKSNQIKERPEMFVKDYSVYELFLFMPFPDRKVGHCTDALRPDFLLLLQPLPFVFPLPAGNRSAFMYHCTSEC
jgi:hypothetical protein